MNYRSCRASPAAAGEAWWHAIGRPRAGRRDRPAAAGLGTAAHPLTARPALTPRLAPDLRLRLALPPLPAGWRLRRRRQRSSGGGTGVSAEGAGVSAVGAGVSAEGAALPVRQLASRPKVRQLPAAAAGVSAEGAAASGAAGGASAEGALRAAGCQALPALRLPSRRAWPRRPPAAARGYRRSSGGRR